MQLLRETYETADTVPTLELNIYEMKDKYFEAADSVLCWVYLFNVFAFPGVSAVDEWVAYLSRFLPGIERLPWRRIQ